jgi:superfamily II DNA or RNA helicase
MVGGKMHRIIIMTRELRPYQIQGINQLASKVLHGKKKLLFQLPTGAGKTVAFAGLVNRFLTKQQRRILILVHREELLKQTIRTVFEWYDIMAIPVTAGMSYLPNGLVYVAMVETANNRLRKNPEYFQNIGLVIVDEAHLGLFRKMFEHYKDTLIIGFTATPIAASKTEPLKDYFEDIVTSVDIPDLIKMGSLAPNKTYHINNVSRKDLKVSRGEFDEREMAAVYSGVKHVQNVIAAYQKLGPGKKAIVFNCNIEHSKKVNEAFLAFGYPSRHLDGETDSREREAIMKWFTNTPGAILNNVGVATTGVDVPSVEVVIMNRSTMSLSLWLQCCGRGSRPFPGKEHFLIIDMGGNALTHGDWSESHDWANMFYFPEKAKKGGEAPLKECKGCGVLIHLSQKICPHCGADNSPQVRYDDAMVSFEQLKSRPGPYIDVKLLIEEYASKKNKEGLPYKEIAVLHEIKRQIVNHAKRSWKLRRIDEQMAKHIVDIYQQRVKEWCNIKLKIYDPWLQRASREWMMSEFKRVWDYEPLKQTA